MANRDVTIQDKITHDNYYPVTRAKNVIMNNNTNVETVLSETTSRSISNSTNITQLSNPNQLINGDFRVNQRGETSYSITSSSPKYTVDRWSIVNSTMSFNTTTKTLSNTGSNAGFFSQFIENGRETLAGKTVTISISIAGNIYSSSGTLPSTLTSTQYLSKDILTGVRIRLDNSGTALSYQIRLEPNTSIVIDWCKLEIGSIATPFSPRIYAEELAMCQRYYQKIASGTMFYGRTGFGADTTCVLFIPLPVTMRTKYTTSITGDLFVYGKGQTKTPTNLQFNSQVLNGFRFTADISTGIGTKEVVVLEGASVELDAEIY